MSSEHLLLNLPPGFRGLHPDLPITTYYRHLPHWRQKGCTYFVTFRLADSIPQHLLRALRRWRALWEKEHPEPRSNREWHEFSKHITNRIEHWLDAGSGSCVLRQYDVTQLMSESLLHFHGVRCFTSSYTVMPNHVHLTIRPFDAFPLENILQSIKAYVARKANQLLNQSGPFWAEESYDRIVRDEEHLYHVIQYIGRNASRACIPPDEWVRWIHPVWESQGWGFRDG